MGDKKLRWKVWPKFFYTMTMTMAMVAVVYRRHHPIPNTPHAGTELRNNLGDHHKIAGHSLFVNQ